MREAGFQTVFCGIETPEPEALKAMYKAHNLMVPILEGVQTLNAYGMEVVSGIIMGLDTDTPETPRAHPRLHRGQPDPDADHQPAAGPAAHAALGPARARAGRLIHDDELRIQRRFRLPYGRWWTGGATCMARPMSPASLFARFEHQVAATYPNRLAGRQRKVRWKDLDMGCA